MNDHPTHHPLFGVLDSEDMEPEGTALDLVWYLKQQVLLEPYRVEELKQFIKIAEEEITRDFRYSMQVLMFASHNEALQWILENEDRQKWAINNPTYRRWLENYHLNSPHNSAIK